MSLLDLCAVTPCGLVSTDQHTSKFLRNVGICLKLHTASPHKRPTTVTFNAVRTLNLIQHKGCQITVLFKKVIVLKKRTYREEFSAERTNVCTWSVVVLWLCCTKCLLLLTYIPHIFWKRYYSKVWKWIFRIANPIGIMVTFPMGGTFFISSDTVSKKSYVSCRMCETWVL